eukprot:13776326-Heterocapsa_arctica.AAC.1
MSLRRPKIRSCRSVPRPSAWCAIARATPHDPPKHCAKAPMHEEGEAVLNAIQACAEDRQAPDGS